jgi:hypothetical protein
MEFTIELTYTCNLGSGVLLHITWVGRLCLTSRLLIANLYTLSSVNIVISGGVISSLKITDLSLTSRLLVTAIKPTYSFIRE